MKIKIFFLISAMNALSYLCFGNCCDECWNCWKKGFGKNKKEDEDVKNEDEKKDENGNGKSEEKKKDEKEKSEENEEKGKIEEQIFLEEKENTEEEVKNFVNKNWLEEKKKPNLKLYKKTESVEEGKIKVTKYKNGEIKIENFSTETNTQKWALFEIKYKEEGEDKFVYLYCSDIETKEDSLYTYGIFAYMKEILSISVLACDTSNVTDMRYMFSSCSNLKNLDLSNCDTSNVTSMQGMFKNCSNLKEIKIQNKFNIIKVTDMINMFSGCKFLDKVIVSKDEYTKNEILKHLSLVGKWEKSEDDDKFILIKNQN